MSGEYPGGQLLPSPLEPTTGDRARLGQLDGTPGPPGSRQDRPTSLPRRHCSPSRARARQSSSPGDHRRGTPRRRLPESQTIDIAIQIIDALVAAHKKGIIHRDIKPANIFITAEGIVKLLDFGIAKLIGQSKDITVVESTGTIAYMSPEQLTGDKIDMRSDIWSFGVIFFEMLTGQRPFGGDYIQTISYSILKENPPDIHELCHDIIPELAALVQKTLEKSPRKRYKRAQDVLNDLQKIRRLKQNQ